MRAEVGQAKDRVGLGFRRLGALFEGIREAMAHLGAQALDETVKRPTIIQNRSMVGDHLLQRLPFNGYAARDRDDADLVDANEQANGCAAHRNRGGRRFDRERSVQRHVFGIRVFGAKFEGKRLVRQNVFDAVGDNFVRDVERVQVNDFTLHGNCLALNPRTSLNPAVPPALGPGVSWRRQR